MKPPTRKQIEANTISFLRTATGTRPDLRLVDIEGRKHVVKDFARSARPFRWLIAPILIRRETGALAKLVCLTCVPQLVSRIGRCALVMEHIPGTSLDGVKPGTLGPEFYERLRTAVDEIHSRGVAHCDLRSRGNVMVGEDGLPYLVDFSAAVFRGRGINPFFRWLFAQFVIADCNAILRIKQRLSPELLTDSETAELAKPLPLERPARFVGENVRKLVRFLFARRRR